MADIKINIAGLTQLLESVRELPELVQQEIEGEIYDSVIRINGMQRRKAPKDQGGLVRNIGFEKKNTPNGSYFEIYSNAEQSGYMEFGTRFRVSVPPQVQAIAEEMRGSGISSRLKAKQAIYAWCKRKGIEKRAWYPIFVAIMTVGVIPHPFFFQPFFDESPQLMQRIERIVNENRQL